MTAKDSVRNRGRRIGRRALAVIADELRTARVTSGTSQSAVAAIAGTSRSTVARYEGARHQPATIVGAAELLAAVGLGLAVSTYPLGDPPRDRRHAALGAAFLAHVGVPLTWRTEVPLPNAGDARAWDATVTGSRKRTGVEFVRVLGDVQALSRRIALKRRDGAVTYLLVVIADTEVNRRLLRQWPTFLPELPRLTAKQVLASLERGEHPGDGIVLFKAPAEPTVHPVGT